MSETGVKKKKVKKKTGDGAPDAATAAPANPDERKASDKKSANPETETRRRVKKREEANPTAQPQEQPQQQQQQQQPQAEEGLNSSDEASGASGGSEGARRRKKKKKKGKKRTDAPEVPGVSRPENGQAEQTVPEDPPLPPATVTPDGELQLAARELTSVPSGLLSRAESQRVRVLDLSFNELCSLSGLSWFANLRTLVLDNNPLTGLEDAPPLPMLTTLSLNNNGLADLRAVLDVVKERFPAVTHLSLIRNPCCPSALNGHDDDDYGRYRFYVLYRLPKLKFLDAGKVEKSEVDRAKKVGMLMIPARPVVQGSVAGDGAPVGADGAAQVAEEEEEEDLFEEEEEDEGPTKPAAFFGVRRYIYKGDASEGNRFVGNSDL